MRAGEGGLRHEADGSTRCSKKETLNNKHTGTNKNVYLAVVSIQRTAVG